MDLAFITSKHTSAALLVLCTYTLFGCASSTGGRSLALNPGLKDDKQAERLLSAMREGAAQTGLASWYGSKFHGRRTANGEVYNMNGISAAHKTLPFGTLLAVKNLDNGRTLEVRVNDRGPFIKGRIIDLSRGAAEKIGLLSAGVAPVELRLVRSTSRRSEKREAADANASQPTSNIDRSWVQIGAFREIDRAQALAETLRAEDSRFEVFSQDGWHRVQARLRSPREANKLMERLRKRNIQAVLMVPN